MSTPFTGEIKMVSFKFAPKNWALANGQSLPINQNQALFALYSVTYGGNGTTNFNLPNLQGRAAMHFGNGFAIGSTGGEAAHTLTAAEVPPHTHQANVSTATGIHAVGNTVLTGSGGETFYAPAGTANSTMAGGFLSNAGGSQPHENRMPYQVINFIVALYGIYPTRG